MLAKIEVNTLGLVAADRSPMNVTTPRQWLAMIAKHGKEQESADWLKRDHYFAYWACYMKQVNAGGSTRNNGFARSRARYTAIIPGFIFVACSYGSRFHPHPLIDTIPGLISYMRNGAGEPATLDEDDIGTIRRIEAGQNLPPLKRAHKFKVGDKVRFTDDLKGRWLPAVVSRVADDGRIMIDQPLLGRIVTITVEPHQIETM